MKIFVISKREMLVQRPGRGSFREQRGPGGSLSIPSSASSRMIEMEVSLKLGDHGLKR